MARNQPIDNAHLIEAVRSYGTVRQLSREVATARLGRVPSEREAENVRRQIQKWLDGAAITPRNLTLLARALQVAPETLVRQPPKDPVEVLAEEVAAMRVQIGRIELLLHALASPQSGLEEAEGR